MSEGLPCRANEQVIADTTTTLRKMVRDQLEKLQPWQRVEFIDSMVAGYCLECGEQDDHHICSFMLDPREPR